MQGFDRDDGRRIPDLGMPQPARFACGMVPTYACCGIEPPHPAWMPPLAGSGASLPRPLHVNHHAMKSPPRAETSTEGRGSGARLPATTLDSVRASLGNLWAGQSRQLPSGVINLLNYLIKAGLLTQAAMNDFLKFHADRLQDLNRPESSAAQ